MLIAIISDIHDNLANLEKSLKWCKENGAAQIFCCGDVANSDTLSYLAKNFFGPVHLVAGNSEIYEERETGRYGQIKYYGRIARFVIDGKNVGLCHEPFLADGILAQGPCEIIFYGHTHKPWIEEKNSVKLVNPGTLGGVFAKATFAVWDTETDKLELKILEEIK